MEKLVWPSDITGVKLVNIKRQWAQLMEKSEIEDFRFHDLRHDYASRLCMKGVDLFTVQKLLGHADISMTQRYSHIESGSLS